MGNRNDKKQSTPLRQAIEGIITVKELNEIIDRKSDFLSEVNEVSRRVKRDRARCNLY